MERDASVRPGLFIFPPSHRKGGLLSTLSGSDVVSVSQGTAELIGPWALADTGSFRGPVRVRSCRSTQDHEVRVPYAARTLLDLQPQDALQLTALPSRRGDRGRLAGRLLRAPAEWLLGAPPLALRCTEGLAGDDGERIARVDSTVFERLGLQPGDEGVLSWGHRSTVVRLLSQTDNTKLAMRDQLEESSDLQVRTATFDPGARLRVPDHLRIWTSAAARHELGITQQTPEKSPDTIVRLRRSLWHVCRRQASAAAVPATALVVAMAAVPDVAWWLWPAVLVVVLLLVSAPVRRTALVKRRHRP